MDSSSSSPYDSYSSNSSVQLNPRYQEQEQERKTGKNLTGFRSSFYSIRKHPYSKNISKKPIAPLPPTRPKIYKVDPLSFKDVVQKLTSAQEFQPTRLQEVAPPPLSLSPPRAVAAPLHEETQRETIDRDFGDLSPLGFSLSPASLAWCSSFIFSPKTISSVEPNPVL
ncbi:hypothetical protein F511_17519 [Dorcoceras hygrometricum]|uniref:VQ domain-containing protein n=1 Tax=Dorcoceras hygrometricum TaxID=472368 RepID=A0A2Z7CR56_9LAMI|nr:hypothetical protein F511_17519 [Dorcoceras hygrometricum]